MASEKENRLISSQVVVVDMLSNDAKAVKYSTAASNLEGDLKYK